MMRHSSAPHGVHSAQGDWQSQHEDQTEQLKASAWPDDESLHRPCNTDQPVQLLPKYLIARHLRDGKRRSGSKSLPHKPTPALEKVYAPILVPSLDLTRARLKPAVGGGLQSSTRQSYDQIRAVTHRQSTRECDKNHLSEAQAAAPPITPSDWAALPAPLMEALLLRGSGQSGAVSESRDLSRAELSRAQARSALVLISQSTPDTLIVKPTAPDTPGARRPNMTPRQQLAHRKSGEVSGVSPVSRWRRDQILQHAPRTLAVDAFFLFCPAAF